MFVVWCQTLSSKYNRKGVINGQQGGLSISKVIVIRKISLEWNTEIKQQLTESDNYLSCKT